MESFLEDINNILNTGDVPNLFDDNDVNSITATMRPLCQAAGLPLTKVALYGYFIKRVRANIHMSLCMSPMGEAFRTRLRNFPSLVNNCTIDFFAEWPEEALRSVAHYIILRYYGLLIILRYHGYARLLTIVLYYT